MSKQYVLNQETNKIELRFSKEEYKALTDSEKSTIKRHFLFSGKQGAWVSRSTKDHYFAKKTAVELGFTDGGREGERLSYAEQVERKAERAEARADRFDEHARNAVNRGQEMQAGFKEAAKDIAFLTQPVYKGHSGMERFGRQRQRLIDRYERGFEEYRKSEYFRDRAETARLTADKTQLKDRRYLNNRIEECNKEIRDLERRIVKAEEAQNEEWLERLLEKMEYEMDKLAYFQNCMDEIGGVQYNKDNIKPGYLVKIRDSWGVVVKANVKTVETKYSFVTYTLNYPYAEIEEVKIPEDWKEPNKAAAENPFQVGDVVTLSYIGGNGIRKAFQVMKTTGKNVFIQEIAVRDNKPVPNEFVSDEQLRRGIKKSHNADVVNYEDWYLYKYNQESA